MDRHRFQTLYRKISMKTGFILREIKKKVIYILLSILPDLILPSKNEQCLDKIFIIQ